MRAVALMLCTGEVDRACCKVALEEGLERPALEEELDRHEPVEREEEKC